MVALESISQATYLATLPVRVKEQDKEKFERKKNKEDNDRLRRNLVENTTTIINTTELIRTFQYINMFALNMRNYNNLYQRQYKKFQDVIGSIDGFLAIFLFTYQIVHDFLLIREFNNILIIKVNNNKINQNKIENSKNAIKNFIKKIVKIIQ